MVAELIIKDCPVIKTIDLGSNLNEVRDNLSTIDFNKPGIHVLKMQPGVGKTHIIKNFLKKKKSFIITTGSHKLLSGEYEGIGAKHWYAMDKKCEIYDNSLVKNLHSHGVSIDIICNFKGCDRKECEYWKQFNTKKVIAPVHYLPTNRVLYKKSGKEFKFDILVFDEAMKEYIPITFDTEEIEYSINIIDKYYHVSDSLEKFMDYLETDNIPSLELAQKINRIKNKALKEAIGLKEWADVNEIVKLNIYGLRKFIYYHNIYGNNESYPEPFVYYALDLALQGKPIIFLDATFDEKAFKILLGRYIYENNIINRSLLLNKKLDDIRNLKLQIYQSNLVNKETKVYRMYKDNYHYRSGFFTKKGYITERGKNSIKELRDYMIKAKRKHTSIGIITYQKLVKEFHDLGQTEYFHNLRGSNKIKDVNGLFIIGTPVTNTENVIGSYNNLILTKYKPDNVERLRYEKKDGKHYLDNMGPFTEKKPSPLVYDSEELTGRTSTAATLELMKLKGIVEANYYYTLPEFDYNLSESEKYQAIHRARPFLKEIPPNIYIFGDVPEQIKKEFKLITLDNEETRKYFRHKFIGIYPLPLFQLINDTFTKNPTLTSEEIAKKLRLYKNKEKKSGFNSRFVTTIKKGKVSIEQMNRIHEALVKDDQANINAIDKHLKSLKVDKEFIEDCIFYAREGNFIL